MKKEVDRLHNIFQPTLRTDVPEGNKILPVVWSFKCMIFPDWFILKWKA
jgi:hypothetical protein